MRETCWKINQVKGADAQACHTHVEGHSSQRKETLGKPHVFLRERRGKGRFKNLSPEPETGPAQVMALRQIKGAQGDKKPIDVSLLLSYKFILK